MPKLRAGFSQRNNLTKASKDSLSQGAASLRCQRVLTTIGFSPTFAFNSLATRLAEAVSP